MALSPRPRQRAKRNIGPRETISVVLPLEIVRLVRRSAERNAKSISLTVEELLTEALFGEPSPTTEKAS